MVWVGCGGLGIGWRMPCAVGCLWLPCGFWVDLLGFPDRCQRIHATACISDGVAPSGCLRGRVAFPMRAPPTMTVGSRSRRCPFWLPWWGGGLCAMCVCVHAPPAMGSRSRWYPFWLPWWGGCVRVVLGLVRHVLGGLVCTLGGVWGAVCAHA